MFFKKIKRKITQKLVKNSSQRYINYLRSQGVLVGKNCRFFGLDDIQIDLTRPTLIAMGDHVVLTRGVTILTHGYDWCVLREKYKEIIGYAQKVKIGNNVFVGMHTRIMPGVTIGDNVIIATGSIVTKDLSSDMVYGGCPAKLLMPLEEYYQRRKKRYVNEAFEYAKSIEKRLNRKPIPEDFSEFFPLFLSRSPNEFGAISVKKQTGSAYEDFLNSTPLFESFEHFLDASKISIK